MTTTPTNVDIAAPQITTPEGSVEGMVAPGQESLLEEFIQEQQAGQQEEQLLAGKFKSVEELERSYQELQRKLGQPDRAEPGPESTSPAQGYSQEQAAQVYGSEAVEALQAKGIDLAEVMFKADSGEDISNHFDDLAEVFQVPRQVVENYVGKAQAAGTQQAATLSDADAAQIKAMVGGDQGFADLSAWASANLDEGELASYNAVVDSGNKAAIEWAIKAMVARRSAPDAVVEPKLYGGGNAPRQTRFESQQQVLDAMNKTNDRGQRLYDVDEAYRNKVAQMMAASDVF